MQSLMGKLMFRQRDAAHEMPRSVAQQFAELRQAHELRQFGGPFGFDERKFVEPLPDVASLAAAQQGPVARRDVQVVEPAVADPGFSLLHRTRGDGSGGKGEASSGQRAHLAAG